MHPNGTEPGLAVSRSRASTTIGPLLAAQTNHKKIRLLRVNRINYSLLTQFLDRKIAPKMPSDTHDAVLRDVQRI